MRYSPDVKFSICKSKKGFVFMGISLSGDACCEHECGINGLREIFGVPKTLTRENVGLKNYLATNGAGDSLSVEEKDGYIYLRVIAKHSWQQEKLPSETVPYELAAFKDSTYLMKDGLCGAWDEGGFFVIAKVNKKKEMDKLRVALETGDIAFLNLRQWNQLPLTSGLAITIASTLPKYVEQDLVREHNESLRGKEAFDASGIEKRLRDAGKRWFALSQPHFDKDGTLVVWLNPMEQYRNNYGWFTLEQLEAWARNEGPIPVQKDKSR